MILEVVRDMISISWIHSSCMHTTRCFFHGGGVRPHRSISLSLFVNFSLSCRALVYSLFFIFCMKQLLKSYLKDLYFLMNYHDTAPCKILLMITCNLLHYYYMFMHLFT